MAMSRDRAMRFARILLDEYCHEGHFDVVLSSVDLPLVDEVFRKEFGCNTKVDQNAERLTVYCPKNLK